MVVQTGRFGQIEVSTDEIISIPSGILGFPDDQNFCLVDPGDETLILWLQSLTNPRLAFPVLEPRIFKSKYIVRLSAAELRELRLASIHEASVFTILTIPSQLPEMTANLKAPLVINVRDRIAKQVVLQENDQPIKHPVFKELRAQIVAFRGLPKESSKAADRAVLAVDSLPLTTKVELI